MRIKDFTARTLVLLADATKSCKPDTIHLRHQAVCSVKEVYIMVAAEPRSCHGPLQPDACETNCERGKAVRDVVFCGAVVCLCSLHCTKCCESLGPT